LIASAARLAVPGGDAQREGAALAKAPHRHDRRHRQRARLALASVLAVQAILSLRLTWSNTAFQDESLYLWAGHLQWANWLHGTAIGPAFPSYFSGAPAIYPPVGALADSIAGLTGARLLSLCFMLGATSLLWSATRRLFDDRAAFFAAAAFALTGAAQFLGAFATFDAMTLLLLAAAAWCAIRASGCGHRTRIALTVAVVTCLVLANATKYASVLWDPVVVALAALTQARDRGRKRGAATGLAVAAAVAAALTVAVLLGGRAYWVGITFSTLERRTGVSSPLAVLRQAGGWIGLLAALAVVGAVIGTRASRDRVLAWTGWVLAAAVLLAPAEQARIHTTVSLFKHVGYGGWFGAVMAGYAIAALTRSAAGRSRPAAVLGSAALLAAAGVVGAGQAGEHHRSWPDSARLIAALRPLARHDQGPALADNPFTPSYYLGRPAAGWASTWYFTYIDPPTGLQLAGLPAYADAIRRGYFKIVVIGLTSTPQTDQAIERDLRNNPRYLLVASVPWSAGPLRGRYLIWRYESVLPAPRRPAGPASRTYSPTAHRPLGLPPKLGR
jgi:MFS family permease